MTDVGQLCHDAEGAASLEAGDEYALYFNHLCEVFSKLLKCYHSGERAAWETESVRAYLIRLLFSIQALRRKHTHNPAHSLHVDLTDSGFPHFLEFSAFDTDLRCRQERLLALPPANMLKQAMLDYMFRYLEEPADLLWQMSERDYYQMLDPSRLLLPFTPGRCDLQSEGKLARSYAFSWACYDFKTNRPYIHLLTFDQDVAAEPLHWKGSNYHQFLDVIRAEGSRVPEIGVLAVAIDSDLESIHPKVLKRICIGPLHSRLACRSEDDLCASIGQHGTPERDFILLIKDEIVFSERQEQLEASFFSPKRVREIYYLPEADLECYEARASVIHHYMLMPHRLLQRLDAAHALENYREYRKLTFDQEGNVHGI